MRLTLFKDTLIVGLAAAIFGFVANGLSPRGLLLHRSYFSDANDRPHRPGTTEASTAAPVRIVRHAEVVRLFRDAAHEQPRVLFVDARRPAQYEAGHIAGALSFDHYQPAQSVTRVVTAALIADVIVVYCTGGGCEDSELAARDLIALGVPDSKILIYAEGWSAWRQHGLPVARIEPGKDQP